MQLITGWQPVPQGVASGAAALAGRVGCDSVPQQLPTRMITSRIPTLETASRLVEAAPDRSEESIAGAYRVQVEIPSIRLVSPQAKWSVAGDLLEVGVGTQELGLRVKARLGDEAVDGAPNGDPL